MTTFIYHEGRTDSNRQTNSRQTAIQIYITIIIQKSEKRLLCELLLPYYMPRHANHAMSWTPRGSGRRRGRPTMTWRSTFKEDLVDLGVDWNSVRAVATNRSRWRTLAAHCPFKDRRIKVLSVSVAYYYVKRTYRCNIIVQLCRQKAVGIRSWVSCFMGHVGHGLHKNNHA